MIDIDIHILPIVYQIQQVFLTYFKAD